MEEMSCIWKDLQCLQWERIAFDPNLERKTSRKKSNEVKRKGDKKDSQRPRIHYLDTASSDEDSDEHSQWVNVVTSKKNKYANCRMLLKKKRGGISY